jgi:preprotein translocase subunit SecE
VNQHSGSELARMLLLVAAVVAVVILVFFGVGYGLGRLLL